MSSTAILYVVYAVVLLAGGALGYSKARSTPSLIAGVVSAVLAVVAALVMHHHPRIGLGLGTLTALIIGVVFTLRYLKTRKAMPAMPILALSAIVLIVSLLKLAKAFSAHA